MRNADTVNTLNSELDHFIEHGDLPGAVVIVQRNGRRLADTQMGFQRLEALKPLAQDSIFRLYSMTKPITSVVVMMLIEQQRLRADDPVEKFLPEFAGISVYDEGEGDGIRSVCLERSITILDLLTHRSGLIYEFTGDTAVHRYYRAHGVMRRSAFSAPSSGGVMPARSLDELIERLASTPLLHQPGATFSYGYSTTVLGAVIERITKLSLDVVFESMIFDPLGMADTRFVVEDTKLDRFTPLYALSSGPLSMAEAPESSEYRDNNRLRDAGGSLVGTAEDYLRFATMLAQNGEYAGTRLLSGNSIEDMFTPRTATEGLPPPSTPFALGLAIGDLASHASGMLPYNAGSWPGAAGTYFFVDREKRAACIFMTHVLGSFEYADRVAAPRAAVNRAALALINA